MLGGFGGGFPGSEEGARPPKVETKRDIIIVWVGGFVLIFVLAYFSGCFSDF